jgi:hypothetical protein
VFSGNPWLFVEAVATVAVRVDPVMSFDEQYTFTPCVVGVLM